MRTLLIAILLALSICSAAADEVITIVTTSREQVIVTAPPIIETAYAPPSVETSYTLPEQEFNNCHASTERSAVSSTAPLTMLAGANWHQSFQLKSPFGIIIDLTGYEFTAEYRPDTAITRTCTKKIIVTDMITAGDPAFIWTSWQTCDGVDSIATDNDILPDDLAPGFRAYINPVELAVITPAEYSGYKTWQFLSDNVTIDITDFYNPGQDVSTRWSYSVDPGINPSTLEPNWRTMYPTPAINTVYEDPIGSGQWFGIKTYPFTVGPIHVLVTDDYSADIVGTYWAYTLDQNVPPETYIPAWRALYQPVSDTTVMISPAITTLYREFTVPLPALTTTIPAGGAARLHYSGTVSGGLAKITLSADDTLLMSGAVGTLTITAYDPAGLRPAYQITPQIALNPSVTRLP